MILIALTPVEYLKKYVEVSESRKHLYNLVFHRYRTKENPMKKSISLPVINYNHLINFIDYSYTCIFHFSF